MSSFATKSLFKIGLLLNMLQVRNMEVCWKPSIKGNRTLGLPTETDMDVTCLILCILISFFLGKRKKFRNLDVFLFQHNIRYCVCTVVYFLYLSKTFHPASNCKKIVRFWLKIYVVLKGGGVKTLATPHVVTFQKSRHMSEKR